MEELNTLYVMIDVSNVLWCIHHQTGWGGGGCLPERERHKGSLRLDCVLSYTTDGELSDRSRVYRKGSLVPYLRAIEIHWRKISLTQLVTL